MAVRVTLIKSSGNESDFEVADVHASKETVL